MRYLRQFCAVTMLVCAFAFSAYAGNIECPGVTSPQPEATTGEMPNDLMTTLWLILALF
jgi:hypothetical protein